MKFLLIKWLTKASSLWMLDLAQWKQVVSIARLVAKDHELELVNIGLVEQDLEVFLFGNQHKINTFIKEFRFELYCYLQTIDKEYSHKALSSLHLIEEIEESDSRLIEAVKTGIATEKPSISSPSQQLIWGAAFGYLSVNPEQMLTWDTPVEDGELSKTIDLLSYLVATKSQPEPKSRLQI